MRVRVEQRRDVVANRASGDLKRISRLTSVDASAKPTRRGISGDRTVNDRRRRVIGVDTAAGSRGVAANLAVGQCQSAKDIAIQPTKCISDPTAVLNRIVFTNNTRGLLPATSSGFKSHHQLISGRRLKSALRREVTRDG